MWRGKRTGLLCVFLISLLYGCQGGEGPRLTPQPPIRSLRAVLSGSQEVPTKVTTGAKGTATITISHDDSRITVSATTSGLTNVTAAHIHVGRLGQLGPVIFTLYTPSDGVFTGSLMKELTAQNLTPQPAQAINTFSDALGAIRQGRTYVNFHTEGNPAGEIRGQIGPQTLRANLSGDEEVPPVATGASGTAEVQLDAEQRTLRVRLRPQGLQGVTMGHIHVGPRGQSGPFIFPLFTGGTIPAEVTLTQSEFQPQNGAPTFDDAIGAILGGQTYVNIHTTAHPTGEIRGQLLPPSD